MSLEQQLEGFLSLSSELTGFSVFDLRGTGEAMAYLEAAHGVVGEAIMAELIAAHAAIDSTGKDRESDIRKQILADARLGPVARSIIKVWFSGVWNALPASWASASGLANNPTFAVRPSSYAEGLLWKTIGANPPGARPRGYGSWAEPPTIPDPESGFSILDIRNI